MEIIDAQVHVGRGQIDATLAAMNALGIKGIVIDEIWGMRESGGQRYIDPGFALPNDAWRALSPTAQEACLRHPDRFAYLLRVDRKDPDLSALMRIVASEPSARAVRILPGGTYAEVRAFAEGAYDELFALADAHGLPIFVVIPGFAELLTRYLERFPRVQVIIDHCGVPFPHIPPDRPASDPQQLDGPAYFEAVVLKLAKYANVALKWAHAESAFNAHEYPFDAARAQLRKAITAFGAERVMWASDYTVIPQHSWSELLHYLREAADFTAGEKEWLLGRSVRQILDWPA